ncbi:hypothetical protein [Paradevosia shaoguanensis]|uniref:Uncharacterized protein n=1 Tax=Paradevosia shaoguanensis TaxID=1335043 RepID=A0AA41UC71_9HYPH|nr:hypothetical protein [Paradevosia shaoguanensis]KFL27351.1 hypothetical protein JP74_07055 [Devosia sp. 17-2-E-8]MCF1743449.1 hypothetical protein [Paradevosia shaoguanensis]MCI0127932.1 hypothetical protein [Paradevosia shaoguanensis]QMV01234.1 hypothetical protein GHV40_06950 [Devosia sp. D6-9]
MLLRDAVLEGPQPAEVQALLRLCREPDYHPLPEIVRQLEAKGWVDTAGETHLVTLTGRTVVER